MIEHEVADHGIGHLLRVADGGLSVTGREALHFDHIAALVLQSGGHAVERFLGSLAQNVLSWAEADFSLVDGMILIDVAYGRLDASQACVGGLSGGLGGIGAVAGVDRVLVGFAGLVSSQLDASLGAGVRVLDGARVAGGQLIEFVEAIGHGVQLALHILLAGEGVDPAPKAFLGFDGQRGLAGGVVRGGGGRCCSGGGGGLGKRRQRKQRGEQDSYDAVLHVFPPRRGSQENPSESQLWLCFYYGKFEVWTEFSTPVLPLVNNR